MSETATAADEADTHAADLAIATTGLTKRFGHQIAVNAIDLAVPRGSVFGFLGPNGSGKTTTIRVLLGLAAATSGSARLLGNDVPTQLAEALPRVGALIEGPAFYPFLSGADNLRRLDSADARADPATRDARVARALDRVGLSHAARKKARAYSLGMKQRLGIAAALLTPRDLLVLDEPTNGLDPQGTREVRSLIRAVAAEGTTVFVSSHLLAEVEQICTHAAVMHVGSLVAQGSLDDLRGTGGRVVRVETPDGDRTVAEFARLGLDAALAGPALRAGPGEVVVEAPLPDDGPAAEDLVAALVAAGVRVRGFDLARPSLEDRFVALTGEGFDVAR
ncbi:ATP-binding cassette domain-containing protein [Occultella aeris]|uniref:Daunorubicin/doxorubicin resistance ATP-binding protein DrrA n=1 Tax=Occultella aeris TaxID=2761496 RepID=A0A7M4DRX3_9MICO|nr:ATP-binding cassette domain-containing protein [Occultella aeris]VZO40217.1 Daunorubicin/doxorubicin resistance ATP-binding protein DrrA [Occultella aeris]